MSAFRDGRYPFIGVQGTKLKAIPEPHFINPNHRLYVLDNCEAEERCGFWLGALDGGTRVGCGINVLRFMSEICETQARRGKCLAEQGEGTPFEFIVDWFNYKLNMSKMDHAVINNIGYRFEVIEIKFDISRKDNLAEFFDGLRKHLLSNTCIIVKLNRPDDKKARTMSNGKILTPGHYVLISKHSDQTLWTYEPYISTPSKCDKREYKGVNDKFFNAYQRQLYNSASILGINIIKEGPVKISSLFPEQAHMQETYLDSRMDIDEPLEIDESTDSRMDIDEPLEIDESSDSRMDIDGGGNDFTNTVSSIPIPHAIMDDFIKSIEYAIENPVECKKNQLGGLKPNYKNRRTNKKIKKNKNKKNVKTKKKRNKRNKNRI